MPDNDDPIIGDLNGPTDFDKVMDLDEAKTYDLKGVEVLILDDKPDYVGDTFKGTVLRYSNPVPLVWNFGTELDQHLGFATLYQEGHILYADLFFRYDSPARLLLETDSAKIYPAVGGVTNKRNGDNIEEAEIKVISVSTTKNSDRRIGYL